MSLSQKTFLEKFNKYHPDGKLFEILNSVTDYAVSVNQEARQIMVDIHLPSLVKKKLVIDIENGIKEAYNLNYVHVSTIYGQELFDTYYVDEEIKELERTAGVGRGFFDDYTYKISGREILLTVNMPSGCLNLFEADLTAKKLSDIVKKEFGIVFDVKITTAENSQPSFEEYLKYQKELENSIMEQMAPKQGTSTESGLTDLSSFKKIRSFNGDGQTEARVNEDGTIKCGNDVFDVSEPEVIFGEEFSILPTPLRNLTHPASNVCIVGRVVGIDEIRETRKGDKLIINFALTDDDASVYCRMFAPKEEADKLENNLFANGKENYGICLAVYGSLRIDKGENSDGELYMSPLHVSKIRRVERKDDAPRKRVELHLHTKMSAMDALIPPEEAVKVANRWGHKAIAFTDHGNVQGIQMVIDTMEKTGQKVIFGMEGYFVDDTARAVYGNKDSDLRKDEFCVFDIETTGLSSFNDKITEIGAVIMKGGELVSSFDTFVNPEMHIPERITELTGITDEMVKSAPSQLEAVKMFLEFAGDRILIAHNANFDISFIRKVCDDNGVPFAPTFLDTVAVSKFVNPELKKHKLDTLAEYYKLGDFDHHRANEDAHMLGLIFECMTDKLGSSGIKSVLQMSAAMADSVNVLNLKTYHIVLLAKNKTGLKNLYKLISKGYLDYFRRFPRIPKTVLDEYREGLIIGSACSEGQLFRAMLENRPRSELVEMASYYDYIEIQPISNNRYLIAEDLAKNDEDLRNFNRELISIAEEAGKPVCATCDAHFLEKHDEIGRKVLLAGMKFRDSDKNSELYLRTTDEMLDEFSYLGKEKAEEVVIDNTNMIADMVEDGMRPFPEGTFTPHIDGADDDLRRICHENAVKKYGDPLPEIVEKRLDKELNSIISNGYAVLYIIAQKLVSFSESQGYLVGSRGSVGSSFVATMAGISEVNPLPPHYTCPKCQYSDFSNPDNHGSGFDLPDAYCPNCGTKLVGDGHNIPFETFLGFFGDKCPDIDLNFSGDVQGRVHKFTEELFGAENVFRAGTIGGLADKTVYGYIMKYLEEHQISVNKAEIARIERLCIEVKRTTGQHPGGIVVVPSDREIYDFCPVQHPADKSDSDIVTTHFTFEYLHDTLLKLDELGHDIPTKYKWLEKYSGTSVLDVPMNDPKVYELFASTEPLGIPKGGIDANLGTYGLPEFGTRFVMKMLEEARPKNFADLLQISGLSHGTGVWTGNAQDLIKEGKRNISNVIGCRDNIMNDLIRYGVENKLAFDVMEKVRKGKGIKPEWVEELKKAGVDDWYIESCQKIKYMFPKAHAAAYVMSAIRLGWYKVNMPVVFYSAFLSAAPGGFDAEIALSGRENVMKTIKDIDEKGTDATQKEKELAATLRLVSECYARKIKFLPVDFAKSDAFAFVPEDGKIRIPFNSLAGVGEAASKSIVEARESGQIFTIEGLQQKAQLSKAVVDILKKNGALDCLFEEAQISLF